MKIIETYIVNKSFQNGPDNFWRLVKLYKCQKEDSIYWVIEGERFSSYKKIEEIEAIQLMENSL